MSLHTAEHLPGINPGDINMEGVGTLKLDVTMRAEEVAAKDELAQVLAYRTPSGKATIRPGHSCYEQVGELLDDPARFGVRTQATAGGNIANISAYYAAAGVDGRVNAFYDPAHPSSQRYEQLAQRHRVPLDPVVVEHMPIATNLIVRHNGDRQVFRYVPYDTPVGTEHLEALAGRVAVAEDLVVVTSAGALAAQAAIEAAHPEVLLSYTPGRELDAPDEMQGIYTALYKRFLAGGRTLMALNRQEAQAVVGAPESAGIVGLAKEINRRELAQTVYITDGPDASIMSDGHNYATFLPPHTEITGTTTGAGDRGAGYVALRATGIETWHIEDLRQTQHWAYEEVVPVLGVHAAMGDLPVYDPVDSL